MPNNVLSGQHIFLGLLDNIDINIRKNRIKNSPTLGKHDIA
jgi:hypothetical protein